MKMDVRDMSAFESGSFGSVIDKGVLIFHRFCFISLFCNNYSIYWAMNSDDTV